MSSLREVPNLPEIIKKYGISVFIETGCDKGDGLRYAAELGLNFRFSCDLNPDVMDLCRQWGHVECEKSTTFLKRAFPKAPALYWLDAHFPEVYSSAPHDPADCWPVLEELEILKNRPLIEKCVIICDDIHCLQDYNNPFKEIPSPDYKHDWKPVEGSIAALLDMFKDTHNARLIRTSTGVLVFEPKESNVAT